MCASERIVVIALLAACGHDSGSSAPVAITAISVRAHEAECLYELRCRLTPSLELCEQGWYGGIYASPSLVAAVQAGEVQYDAEQMTACIEAIETQPCDRYTTSKSEVLEACVTPAYTGAVPSGGACNLLGGVPSVFPYYGVLNQCASQSCDTSACMGSNTCCQGTCVGDTPPTVGPVPLGSPCELTGTASPCEDGTYCDDSIYPRICVAQLDAGAACHGDEQCGFDLACLGRPGTCQPVPALGEPCPDGKCRDVDTICNSALVCERVGLPGDPCESSEDCGDGRVPWQCDTSNHVCVRPPIAGEPCTNTCYDGSLCASGYCRALAVNGSACTDGQECVSGYCDGAACAPAPLCF